MRTPKVSVVMPVYNGELYMCAAIESILKQTFTDFELIIINDGSSDSSSKIIESFSDPRIVYINNSENTGLAKVRNKGLDVVRGEYIAWLDCDDISLPTRLEKQVNLLDVNLDIGICGTWVKTIDGESENIWRYPTDSGFIRARMLFDDPLATSSVMLRAACISVQRLRFNLDYPPAEDYELWERISREWDVTNIPEVLTYYRIHPMQTSVVKEIQQKASVWEIQKRMLAQLGIEPTKEEKLLVLDIGVGWRFIPEIERVLSSKKWLEKLEAANCKRNLFSSESFKYVLAERWFLVTAAAAHHGLKVWKIYYQSELSRWSNRSYWRLAKLFVLCLKRRILCRD